jgi:hypothetical protein
MKAYRSAGVDLLNKAVQLLRTHNGDAPTAIAALRRVTLASLGHASWSEEERRKLEEGAQQHNNDIAEIANTIPTKKMGDVVKRYYIHLGCVSPSLFLLVFLAHSSFPPFANLFLLPLLLEQSQPTRRRSEPTRRKSRRSDPFRPYPIRLRLRR